MNRSRVSERHYFMALAIPIMLVASWCFDTRSGERHKTKKQQNKIISCGSGSYMKVGIEMFSENKIEKTDNNAGSINKKNGGASEWLFTRYHPCPHSSGPGVAICMLAWHKRRFLKITSIHIHEAEHFYS